MQSGTMHVHPHPQDSQMLWDKYGRMQRKDGDWIRSLHPYVGARGLSRHICHMIILMSNLFVLCLNMCMYYILICVMISRKNATRFELTVSKSRRWNERRESRKISCRPSNRPGPGNNGPPPNAARQNRIICLVGGHLQCTFAHILSHTTKTPPILIYMD